MKNEILGLDKKYSRFLEIDKQIDLRRNAEHTYGLLPETAGKDKKIEELNEQIGALEREKADLLDELVSDFFMLNDNRYFTVLKLHYIDGLTWNEMSAETRYTPHHLMRLRNEALEKMLEIKTSD